MYTSVFDIHVDNIQNSACSMDMYIMYYIIVYYIYVEIYVYDLLCRGTLYAIQSIINIYILYINMYVYI